MSKTRLTGYLAALSALGLAANGLDPGGTNPFMAGSFLLLAIAALLEVVVTSNRKR